MPRLRGSIHRPDPPEQHVVPSIAQPWGERATALRQALVRMYMAIQAAPVSSPRPPQVGDQVTLTRDALRRLRDRVYGPNSFAFRLTAYSRTGTVTAILSPSRIRVLRDGNQRAGTWRTSDWAVMEESLTDAATS
jgi:hypothetical protein